MQEIGSHLVIDQDVCHGQLTFKGTRIPVDAVLSYLAKGYSINQLVGNWPELTCDAIEETIRLAANSLQVRYIPDLWATSAMPVVAAY